MSRDELLAYIASKHGAALQRVGVTPSDTSEALAFVLHDACQYEDTATQQKVADRETAQLIIDKAAAIGMAPFEEE
jgi:hypothetical protein